MAVPATSHAEMFGPLEAFARGVPGFDADEWMYMGRCDRGHALLWSYKNSINRCYLHLDASAHAYAHSVWIEDEDVDDPAFGCAAAPHLGVSDALDEAGLSLSEPRCM